MAEIPEDWVQVAAYVYAPKHVPGETNCEDMTYREWGRAAFAWGVPVDEAGEDISKEELYQAWKDGVDPTEFAARTRPQCPSAEWRRIHRNTSYPPTEK